MKNQLSLAILGVLLALVVASPSDAVAQTAPKTNQSCLRAYGHLIAPGWIKKSGPTENPAECPLPFGIAKKLTPEPDDDDPIDTNAPLINNLTVTPSIESAMVSWQTNELARATVYYATSSPLDHEADTTMEVGSGIYTLNHQFNLDDLVPDTTYYLMVRVRDLAGNETFSNQTSFTTGPDVDLTAPSISQIIAVIGTSTIKVDWQTNEAARSKIYYGIVSPLDLNSTSTPMMSEATLKTAHSLTLSGLATSTQYYLVIEAEDAAGNTATTSELSLHTGA